VYPEPGPVSAASAIGASLPNSQRALIPALGRSSRVRPTLPMQIAIGVTGRMAHPAPQPVSADGRGARQLQRNSPTSNEDSSAFAASAGNVANSPSLIPIAFKERKSIFAAKRVARK
jgi:hypothetical protein